MKEPENQNYGVSFAEYGTDMADRLATLGGEGFTEYRRFQMDGENKVVILQSRDVLLLNSLVRVFEDFDPRARSQRGIERALSAAESGFSIVGRLPKVELVRTDNDLQLFCEEGTCKFHLDNSCLKGELTGDTPELYDHNPERIWCMDYSPSEETRLNPPYPSSFEEERIESEEQYRIKKELVNNLRKISQNGALQAGYTGLAGGIFEHIAAGNVEIRIQKGDDNTFEGSDALFGVGVRRFGRGIRASFVLVNRDYEKMREEAAFANDAFTLRVFSAAILGAAALPYIPHRFIGRVDSMDVVDAIISHQLIEVPRDTQLNDFARNLVEAHQSIHPHN